MCNYCEIPMTDADVIYALKQYLRDIGLRFECSECYDNILFAVDVTAQEDVDCVNEFIDWLYLEA